MLPVDDVETSAALARVRAFLLEELGNADLPLAAAFVPTEFHELIPLAEQFGVGDDPAREIAIDMMPASFVEWVAQLIARHREALDEWLLDGEWNDERNSFACLLQAFDYATTVPVHSNVVSLEAVKALRALLRDDDE